MNFRSSLDSSRFIIASVLLFAIVAVNLPCETLQAQERDVKVLFESDFSQGMKAWDALDDGWKIKQLDDPGSDSPAVLSLFKKKTNYKPPFRSPGHIALIRGQEFGSFELNVDVLSTHKDYNHRDVCFFFGFEGPGKYYYVHLGKKMDPHANQIFIVNQAARTKISLTTTEGTNWDDQWHKVRIRRDIQSGSIEVYYDDMEKPVMTAKDKTFVGGKIGVGSFDDTADFKRVQIRELK